MKHRAVPHDAVLVDELIDAFRSVVDREVLRKAERDERREVFLDHDVIDLVRPLLLDEREQKLAALPRRLEVTALLERLRRERQVGQDHFLEELAEGERLFVVALQGRDVAAGDHFELLVEHEHRDDIDARLPDQLLELGDEGIERQAGLEQLLVVPEDDLLDVVDLLFGDLLHQRELAAAAGVGFRVAVAVVRQGHGSRQDREDQGVQEKQPAHAP
jgi:hypothetical protein